MSSCNYRIRRNFRGLPIFAVFRGQYESAKIKIAKYFPISVNESSLEAKSIFAVVTSSFPLLRQIPAVFVCSRKVLLPTGTGSNPNENFSVYRGNQCHAFRLRIYSFVIGHVSGLY